ncbi:hypothetical protein KKC88_01530 [Patescibacteria group bacterium]|nr:hypothetical protein [Patescibacteria group bacterium]MBU1673190.1 hypothetical protein [Patescibacteria group bacterium]
MGCNGPHESLTCPEGDVRDKYEDVTARTDSILAEITCSSVITPDVEDSLLDAEDELIYLKEEFQENCERPWLYNRCPKTIDRYVEHIRTYRLGTKEECLP